MSDLHFSFKARMYQVSQLYCVDVPADLCQQFGESGGIPVLVRMGDGPEAATTIVRSGSGSGRLFLHSRVRAPFDFAPGDMVPLHIRRDPNGGEPHLPDDLVQALLETSDGMDMLFRRSPSDRRQLVSWLQSAVKPETRARRVRKAVSMVLQGPPDPKPRSRRS